jgi:hypothetical protein
MSRKKSSAPSISVPALSRLLGVPERSMYRHIEGRGPIPLDRAIPWLEQELQKLYRLQTDTRRTRALEDALRELRVSRALARIQARPKRRSSGINTSTGPKPRRYDPETGAILQEATP